MLFAGPRLRVLLATIHVPLAEVSKQLSVDRLRWLISLGARALRRDFGVATPHIGVLGLNPHCGEEGAFGDEEIRIIQPAIAAARAELGPGVDIDGPLVPDAAYRLSCDLFIAMYHDQALIPVKLLDFEDSVNVTLGLPIIRTSPDHGVAYDIAGTGRARSESMRAALELAASLLARHQTGDVSE
jgi:4-hydroxythreonine-4-phosphate dehydrogenase